MKYALLLSLGLGFVAACSSSTGTVPTNEPGSASEDHPQDDGDPGPAPDNKADVDVGLPGDNGAIADTDTPPDGGDGSAAGDGGPTVGDDGPPKSCAAREVDVPLQLPWRHWPEGQTIVYDQNPPAGGQSYEMWAEYREYVNPPLDRGHWNHNLRHGAIVMLYRPDAPADVIAALRDALPLLPTPGGKYQADPKCPSMGILTPDPLMDDTYAVLAWGKMLTSDCAPKRDDILAFAKHYVFEAPEKECFSGAWPVRLPCFRYETVRDIQYTHEVPDGTAVAYNDEPPSSGPYYPKTLAYGRYATYVPAPYWIKILANGGIVALYRPDADPAMIAKLVGAYDALTPHWKCQHPMTAMVQDPNLPTPYAVVGFGSYMEGKCFEGWELEMFVTSRRGWGPLDSCADGTYVPPAPPAAPPPRH